jgi:polyphosphate kinase
MWQGISVNSQLPQDRFLDRELSWLSFNQRVLDLAKTPDTPLLEKIRFLTIFTNNLDEFFMVRVAGLKRRIAAGIATRAVSGKLPRETHRDVLRRSKDLQLAQTTLLHDELLPELAKHGIQIIRWQEVDADNQARLEKWFHHKVFPVLTPLAVDPSHPFPYISGLSLNLAISVKNPQTGQDLFARIKVPPLMDRFVRASQTEDLFVPIEDVIAAHLTSLFPGMEIMKTNFFRVTRNEDLEVEEDDAENLLAALERELTRRRFGPAVRLEVENSIDKDTLELLIDELEVDAEEVFQLPWPLDLRGLETIANINRDEFKYPAFVPKTSTHLAIAESASEPNVLEAMSSHDILLHHPYDAFSTSVQLFLEQAARDPQVLAIKQTLYRTSGDSPIVKSLIEAAEAGKQVLALVEIKARFDEEANIEWARKLEEAGVHVVYGLVGLKTHCKLSMVVRDEGDDLRRYVHIGTGNYHPKTARLYEDLGILSTDPQITADVATLFNVLSGYAVGAEYKRLLVAPAGVRVGLLALIEEQISQAQSGNEARIQFKCNALVDEVIADALYRASQAGVKIDLLVRGICALKPGVAGLSDNIRVHSLLGRFLEHSRMYVFGVGETTKYFIGSADMMHRNLDRRVETLVEIRQVDHKRYLAEIMELGTSDNVRHWNLSGDGTWTQISKDENGNLLLDFQTYLIGRHPGPRSA